MVTFSVPLKDSKKGSFFEFNVDGGSVLFAGSRHEAIPLQVCKDLVSAFGSLGFSFFTGCASGVDESFRKALSLSKFKDHSTVACAFKDRAKRIKEIRSLFVVPQGLPPKVALAKRTLWMTSRCSLLVLFPFGYAQGKPFGDAQPDDSQADTPEMGRGSALAFKSAIYNNKPVFVVTSTKLSDTNLYSVYHSSLFGVVQGYWCIPPVYQKTLLCHEAV